MNSVSGLVKTGLLICLMTIVGCVRVPDVEQGLQSLHFQPNTYVVQSGDTLESIAFRYRINADQLASLNRHVGPEPLPGERLIIRRSAGIDGDMSRPLPDRVGTGTLLPSHLRSARKL